MPKMCKYCGKPFLKGLRAFCSEECKVEYRRAYLAEKKRNERAVESVNSRKRSAILVSPICDQKSHKVFLVNKKALKNPLISDSEKSEKVPSEDPGGTVTTRCSGKYLDHDWRAAGKKIWCARCKREPQEGKKEGQGKAEAAAPSLAA